MLHLKMNTWILLIWGHFTFVTAVRTDIQSKLNQNHFLPTDADIHRDDDYFISITYIGGR